MKQVFRYAGARLMFLSRLFGGEDNEWIVKSDFRFLSRLFGGEERAQ